MVQPSDLTGFLGNQWWNSFSWVGQWLSMIFGVVLIMALLVGIFYVLQFKIKVTYYPLQGGEDEENITIGRPKLDRGRRIKKRGIPYFKLLMARKTLKDIPYEQQYTDGVFLVRKSNDEFIPIARPTLGNPSIKIQVMDPALQLWDQLRGQEIIKRFTDEDWQKRQMLIFVGVIIGCLIFAGIVIWMSYATSNATLVKTGQVTTALNGLAEKIGIGAPG